MCSKSMWFIKLGTVRIIHMKTVFDRTEKEYLSSNIKEPLNSFLLTAVIFALV